MKKESLILSCAVGLATASTGLSSDNGMYPEWAKKGDVIVKCAGISLKGKNDCGANNHACTGKATKTNDPKEWVWVPDGVCDKITFGEALKKVTIEE